MKLARANRPFRLIYWAALVIVGFAFYYRYKMPRRIFDFIRTQEQVEERQESYENPWIHSLYFSAMVFFTFRLNRAILTFFNKKERRIVVTQWTVGFLVYVAFLTLSKSGSILQQLKTLFIG